MDVAKQCEKQQTRWISDVMDINGILSGERNRIVYGRIINSKLFTI